LDKKVKQQQQQQNKKMHKNPCQSWEMFEPQSYAAAV